MNNTQQWDVCRDCLVPLEKELRELAFRWNTPFVEDDTASDDLGGCSTDSVRRKEEPPRAFYLWTLYEEYDVKLAVECLSVNVSCEYGEKLKQRLWGIHDQLAKLEFRCCQILSGDDGADTTIVIRSAVQRLIARHEVLLREMFPSREERPEVSDMPHDMQIVEAEVVETYSGIGRQLFDVCEWLECVVLAVDSSQVSQSEDLSGKPKTGRKPISDQERLDFFARYEDGLSEGRWKSQEEYASHVHMSPKTVSDWLTKAKELRSDASSCPKNVRKTKPK